MSGKQNKGRDPEKRAGKRAAQRAAVARGARMQRREAPPAQMTHASSGRAQKKSREGTRALGITKLRCPDCGAPRPDHFLDCLQVAEAAAGVETITTYSNEAPRNCKRCGSAMTRHHDQDGERVFDICTGLRCGVTVEVTT